MMTVGELKNAIEESLEHIFGCILMNVKRSVA